MLILENCPFSLEEGKIQNKQFGDNRREFDFLELVYFGEESGAWWNNNNIQSNISAEMENSM